MILLVSMKMGVYSQSPDQETNYTEIGKPCPDLAIRNISYYPKKQTTIKEMLRDHQGKWLFLYLFRKECGACVEALPGYSEMQKKYGSRIQFMIVGMQDKEGQMGGMYARYRKQCNLIMPFSVDSTIFHELDMTGSPNLVIIDPQGIVRYVTAFLWDGGETKDDEKNLLAILNGGHPNISKRYRDHEPIPAPPVVTDTTFLYRSSLGLWAPGMKRIGSNYLNYLKSPAQGATMHYTIQLIGEDLERIYSYAFRDNEELRKTDMGQELYGKVSRRILLDIRDSSDFNYDYNTGKHIYNYTLMVPADKFNEKYLRQTMQSDLRRYFGYDAGWEMRKMPYWRVVATDEGRTKLKTKGGTPYAPTFKHGEYRDSFTIRNEPIAKMIESCRMYLDSRWPILDETGIQGNIDMTITGIGVMDDISTVRDAFRKYGLDLVQGEKEMKVFVIRKKSTDEKETANNN